MLHIVSFSTGLSSAITAERVLNRYGKDNTIIVFMDTKTEDADNYRFMADCKKRWKVEVVGLSEGRTPFQVFTDQHIIPNSRIAPCTFRLKIGVFRKYLETLPKPITIHIGYDFSEVHRCGPTEKNYKDVGYEVDFPLLWKPYEFRKHSFVVREEWGIEPPRMYEMGYTHANCGGLCVKQGQGDWLRTLINFPERFQMAEDWEREMRNNPIHSDYAILKESKGKDFFPLTLESLRMRHEKALANKSVLPDLLFGLDSASSCVSCGVGDFVMMPPVLDNKSK